MNKGWIIEEQVNGINRWFRTNAWIYESAETALDLADRLIKVDGNSKVRVLEIEYTDPRCIRTVGGTE